MRTTSWPARPPAAGGRPPRVEPPSCRASEVERLSRPSARAETTVETDDRDDCDDYDRCDGLRRGYDGCDGGVDGCSRACYHRRMPLVAAPLTSASQITFR